MFDELIDNESLVAAEQDSSEVSQQAPALEQPNESPAEKNFRITRQLKEKAERERDEAYRALQEINAKINKPKEDEEDTRYNPDDLVEWKHIEKKLKKIEAQTQQYQQQMNEALIESRIKGQFPDFDSVVSQENLDALRTHHPEIAMTLNSSTDLYNKAVAAYTMIKKLGVHADHSEYQQEKQRIEQNKLKPKPLSSIAAQSGDTPLSRANAFAEGKVTDDLRKQLWKEMEEARKNY